MMIHHTTLGSRIGTRKKKQEKKDGRMAEFVIKHDTVHWVFAVITTMRLRLKPLELLI
jgi:hypothetical protein